MGARYLSENGINDENILYASNGITGANRWVGRIAHAAKGCLRQNLQRIILRIELRQVNSRPRTAASGYNCRLGVVALRPARSHKSSFENKGGIENMLTFNSNKAGDGVIFAGQPSKVGVPSRNGKTFLIIPPATHGDKKPIIVRRIEINAQSLSVFGDVQALLNLIVEICAIDIGQRKEVEIGLRARVNAISRNDATYETSGISNFFTDASLAGISNRDGLGKIAVRVFCALRKVAHTFKRRGHGNLANILRTEFALLLFGKEEEKFLLVARD